MKAAALALALALAAAPAWAKPRVASINVCTDQLVLALADDDQIVSLSESAESPNASFLAERASALGRPPVRGGAEGALLLSPDLVLTGAWEYATRQTLARLGVPAEGFDEPRDLDDVAAQFRRAGALLEQPERAERMVAELDAARARARAHPAAGERVVLYYTGGYTYGAGTLLNAMIAELGAVNVAAAGGVVGVGRLDLETLVVDRPTRILSDDSIAGRAPRVDTQLLRHPALARAMPGARPTGFPLRYWICGASAAAALDFLGNRLR